MLNYLLLVDHEENGHQIEQHVKKINSSYRSVTASDGKSAIRMFKLMHPSKILINFQLPDMTGLECLRKMQLFAESNKQFYIYSSQVTSHLISNALLSGAKGCFGTGDKKITHYLKQVLGSGMN